MLPGQVVMFGNIPYRPIKKRGAKAKDSDESGIRTHASGETGALNQRLRPLGHLAMYREAWLQAKIARKRAPLGNEGAEKPLGIF